MSGAPPRRPLPPPPRRRDWLAAGASAGALLGLAEAGVLQLRGASLAPGLTLVIVGGTALGLCVGAGALGFAWSRLGGRPERAALIGAVLGLMVLAPAVASVARALREGAWLAGLGLLLLPTAVAAAAAGLAMQLVRRLSQAGLPPSGWPFWFAGAALVAIAESATDAAGVGGLAWVAGGVLLAGVLGAAGVLGVRRRLPARARSWGFGFAALAAAALALAYAPQGLPWLLLDGRELPPVTRVPASVLALGLPAGPLPGAEPAQPGAIWDVLAADGITYERLYTGGPANIEAFFALPGGTSLAAALAAKGYAAVALLRDPALGIPAGFPERDTSPGSLGLLMRHGRSASMAGFLIAGGSALRRPLGLDEVLRTPDQLVDAALAWFVRWRGERAQAPYFAFVDFAAVGGAGDPRRVDAGVERMLARLYSLEALDNTWVLAVRTPRGSEPAGSWQPLQAVVRPPPLRPFAPGRVTRSVDPGMLMLALSEELGGDPSAPLALPGVAARAPAGADAAKSGSDAGAGGP